MEDDFEDWCIIENPNSCNNEYYFEKISTSSASVNYSPNSLDEENDFELLTEVPEDDSLKTNDSFGSYFTSVDSASLSAIENDLKLIDVEGINSITLLSTYVDAENDIENGNEDFDDEDNLEGMILFQNYENENEEKNLDEIVPLLEFYKYPSKRKKLVNWCNVFDTKTDTSDVNELDLTIFDDENLSLLKNDQLSRIRNMAQSFEHEVGPDNIDHICLDEEFHLPLMNKFCILDCIETER